MYDELNKISTELNLPTGSVMKIEDFTETLRVKNPVTGLKMDKDFDLATIKLDLDAIRDALAEGKQISAFIRGGAANSEDIKVLPVRFTRLLQAAESPAEAMELGRSLGMKDREILEELEIIENNYLFRPDMLYGDFRDLTLEELQALREAEMERGVTTVSYTHLRAHET